MAILTGNLKSFFILIFFQILLNHSFSQVYINEILTDNRNVNCDPDFKNYGDWIELYNPVNQDFNLEGYYLTDNLTDTKKWPFPANSVIKAKGYLIIWADDKNTNQSALHSNFKLQGQSSFVGLFSPHKALMDSISYYKQRQDVSFGRKPDGANKFFFFQIPTPGGPNFNSEKNGISDPPVFSIKGGFYNKTQILILSSDNQNDEIRFTIDGSDPNARSSLYKKKIDIPTTLVIKAICIGKDEVPSDIITNTYIIGQQFKLPVVSLSTNPANLWDDSIGIYIRGKNGITGLGSTVPVNWNQDWERPANIEFYDTSGNQCFNQLVGIKISGGWSRIHEQKSLAVFARDKYGKDKIEYKLFKDKDLTEFTSFILRNSGNDWGVTMFRDALHQTLVKKLMEVDYQEYQPSVVFLNGQYWGILNIREKINEDYCASNFNIDPDNINIIDSYKKSVAGDPSSFNSLTEYISSNDMSKPNNYEYIKTNIDIEEFIDYHIAQIYFANTDWPGNNLKIWSPNEKSGRWRWIIYDTDFGFAGTNSSPEHNTLTFALKPDGNAWPNPANATLFLRKLMVNNEFKNEFVQRFAYHLNNTFNPTRVIRIIDSLQANLTYDMPKHIERWGSPYNMDIWYRNILVMKNFAKERIPILKKYINDYFKLEGDIKINLDVTGNGKIKINNDIFPGNTTTSSFINIPLSLKALPGIGNIFKYWIYINGQDSNFIILPLGSKWKYFDKGYNPNLHWMKPGFDDSSWMTGQANFNYDIESGKSEINYGPDSDNKYITTYFRTFITINDTSHLKKLILKILRFDGAVIYLNGNEVYRKNLPAGEIKFNTKATLSYSSASQIYNEGEIDLKYIKNGVNCLAVELHRGNLFGTLFNFDLMLSGIMSTKIKSDTIKQCQFTTQLYGDANISAIFRQSDTMQNHLFINEILAQNDSVHADEHGDFDDWIELYNSSSDPIDIGGYFVTDDIYRPVKFRIPDNQPNNTTVPPGGFLILWADEDTTQGPLHLNFKLNKNGEQIALFKPIGEKIELTDSVTFYKLPDNKSFGRYSDGNSDWKEFYYPTPDYTNNAAFPMEMVMNNFYFNELIIENNNIKKETGNRNGWIEILNAGKQTYDAGGLFITDDINEPYKIMITKDIPQKTMIPRNDFLILWFDNSSEFQNLHLDLNLNKNGGELFLVQKIENSPVIIDYLNYPALEQGFSFGRIPNLLEQTTEFKNPTPGEPNLMNTSYPGPVKNIDGFFKIYPNPAEKFITIDLNNKLLSKGLIINIYDIYGKMMMRLNQFQLSDNHFLINIQKLKKGIYLIQVNTEDKIYTKKIIVK